jgi:hypothetical protein
MSQLAGFLAVSELNVICMLRIFIYKHFSLSRLNKFDSMETV